MERVYEDDLQPSQERIERISLRSVLKATQSSASAKKNTTSHRAKIISIYTCRIYHNQSLFTALQQNT